MVWGDYQEPFTAEADGMIRALLANRSDASYEFRHYPINKACNPVTPRDMHPLACRASFAAEAAGQLGGTEAYWSMHVWLMENQKQLSDQTLVNSLSAGLDFTPVEKQFLLESENLLQHARRLTDLIRFKLPNLQSPAQG